MIYAYTRQTPGGPGTRERLESQTEALKRESPDRLVIEKIPKGKRKKMDDFWDLFRVMKRGDTLVIPSVDRVSHSASDFSGLIKGLRNKGVTVKVLNIGVLDDSPEGRARLQTIEAFGEFEKAMVVERTQGEKSRARSDAAYQEGRPRKYSWKELNAALNMDGRRQPDQQQEEPVADAGENRREPPSILERLSKPNSAAHISQPMRKENNREEAI